MTAETGREVRVVTSEDRPVPLDWSYLFTTVREAVFQLVEDQKSPVYCVSFTQERWVGRWGRGRRMRRRWRGRW